MAFSATGLAQVAYGNGQKLWIYNTTDSTTTVLTANYFVNNDIPLMTQGDVIMATCAAAGSKELAVAVVSVIAAATSTLSICK